MKVFASCLFIATFACGALRIHAAAVDNAPIPAPVEHLSDDSIRAQLSRVGAECKNCVTREQLVENYSALAAKDKISLHELDGNDRTLPNDSADAGSANTPQGNSFRKNTRKTANKLDEMLEKAKNSSTEDIKGKLDTFAQYLKDLLSNSELVSKAMNMFQSLYPGVKNPEEGAEKYLSKFIETLKNDPKASDKLLSDIQAAMKGSKIDPSIHAEKFGDLFDKDWMKEMEALIAKMEEKEKARKEKKNKKATKSKSSGVSSENDDKSRFEDSHDHSSMENSFSGHSHSDFDFSGFSDLDDWFGAYDSHKEL